ncbi:MAG: AAA family ATPase [Catonella sp.]|nr:AAA family ATPase [Catonella sp.]
MKNLPTGWDDFERVIKDGYYYVDKTKLIGNLIETRSAVTLFTRPRRFGKTLNMSMLKNFFEIGSDPSLFDGLAIADNKELCQKYQGKYPVISISLKTVSGLSYGDALNRMRDVIGHEAERFNFLLESDNLTENDKIGYRRMIMRDEKTKENYCMSEDTIISSLFELSYLLKKHYATNVIILIDEYDVPLDKAHVHGYYDKMVELIRGMFHAALKTNPNLAFGVLTGCLRVSKESIFTGLNNLDVYSISDLECDDLFGFNETEVTKILEDYYLTDKKPEVKAWYDGYKFGKKDVYCPWDVLKYVEKHINDRELEPQNYWANSSSNELVREFVDISTKETTEELEKLVAGEKVEKLVNENLTYRDLDGSIDNLWGILYATGYLTGTRGADNIYTLWIPNKEVRQIYEDDILKWFDNRVRRDTESATKFYNACLNCEPAEMNKVLNKLLRKSVSVRDTFARKDLKENFYHGFILGLLSQFGDIQSNREGGNGFSDITIVNDKLNKAAILELKYSETEGLQAMEKVCDEALKQIDDKNYAEDLILSGYDEIYKYGISFNKKRSFVKISQ